MSANAEARRHLQLRASYSFVEMRHFIASNAAMF